MATCHVALAHGDRSNGAVLLAAAAADKASLVRYDTSTVHFIRG